MPRLEARYTIRVYEGGPVDPVALQRYLDEQSALGVPVNAALCLLLRSGLNGEPTPLHAIRQALVEIRAEMGQMHVAPPQAANDDPIDAKLRTMFDKI